MKPSGAGGGAGFRQPGDLSETGNTYKSQFPQLKSDATVQTSMIKYECTHQRFRVISVNPARNAGKIRQAGSFRPDPPWIYGRWVDLG